MSLKKSADDKKYGKLLPIRQRINGSLFQVLTTEYNPEEWSKETEDLMTEPIPEQPGTNVDTKDTSVDKAPAPQEGKVSSTTPAKTEPKGERVAPAITKEVSRTEVKAAPKEPARGSEGTEMRQRKSTSR